MSFCPDQRRARGQLVSLDIGLLAALGVGIVLRRHRGGWYVGRSPMVRAGPRKLWSRQSGAVRNGQGSRAHPFRLGIPLCRGGFGSGWQLVAANGPRPCLLSFGLFLGVSLFEESETVAGLSARASAVLHSRDGLGDGLFHLPIARVGSLSRVKGPCFLGAQGDTMFQLPLLRVLGDFGEIAGFAAGLNGRGRLGEGWRREGFGRCQWERRNPGMAWSALSPCFAVFSLKLRPRFALAQKVPMAAEDRVDLAKVEIVGLRRRQVEPPRGGDRRGGGGGGGARHGGGSGRQTLVIGLLRRSMTSFRSFRVPTGGLLRVVGGRRGGGGLVEGVSGGGLGA